MSPEARAEVVALKMTLESISSDIADVVTEWNGYQTIPYALKDHIESAWRSLQYVLGDLADPEALAYLKRAS